MMLLWLPRPPADDYARLSTRENQTGSSLTLSQAALDALVLAVDAGASFVRVSGLALEQAVSMTSGSLMGLK